jgi:hypothetical protein
MSTPDQQPDKKPNVVNKTLTKSKEFFKGLITKKDTTKSDIQPIIDVQPRDGTQMRNAQRNYTETRPAFMNGMPEDRDSQALLEDRNRKDGGIESRKRYEAQLMSAIGTGRKESSGMKKRNEA